MDRILKLIEALPEAVKAYIEETREYYVKMNRSGGANGFDRGEVWGFVAALVACNVIEYKYKRAIKAYMKGADDASIEQALKGV